MQKAAEQFIQEEKQYQLGFLRTEASHPVTKKLSQTVAQSSSAGVSLLQKVDDDLLFDFRKRFSASGQNALIHALEESVQQGKKIAMSGCGSTGRLSVILEVMWRRAAKALAANMAESDPEMSHRLISSAEAIRGIITGGDRALIRSVENFEDYQQFGAEQVRELDLKPGDLFLAISEGGETSSVIGSAFQALEHGAAVFFVYNNPTELLCSNIERSRKLITDSRVTCIDLTTGPMALSGSTRMQATSAEMLYIGLAMEQALRRLNGELQLSGADQWYRDIETFLSSLKEDSNLSQIAAMLDAEILRCKEGRLTAYRAQEYLLDVFSDTTERTPTFSIPPFLPRDASVEGKHPWAVAYYPGLGTEDAWQQMIGRKPVGLHWSEEDYRRLGTPELAKTPPVLNEEEIYRYPIGEDALSFYRGRNVAVETISVAVRGHRLEVGGHAVSLAFPDTYIKLFEHLAIKLVLNTVSTASMAALGRVHGNWMVHVTPSNKKLVDRSIRIISDLNGWSYEEAADAFFTAYLDPSVENPSIVAGLIEK